MHEGAQSEKYVPSATPAIGPVSMAMQGAAGATEHSPRRTGSLSAFRHARGPRTRSELWRRAAGHARQAPVRRTSSGRAPTMTVAIGWIRRKEDRGGVVDVGGKLLAREELPPNRRSGKRPRPVADSWQAGATAYASRHRRSGIVDRDGVLRSDPNIPAGVGQPLLLRAGGGGFVVWTTTPMRRRGRARSARDAARRSSVRNDRPGIGEIGSAGRTYAVPRRSSGDRHMLVTRRALCGCGRRGCWEQFASGPHSSEWRAKSGRITQARCAKSGAEGSVDGRK